MRLRNILETKGSQVYTIAPSATLQDVANLMVEHNCGSLVVMQDGQMTGIITERDILRAAAASHQPLKDFYVQDHMSVELVTGGPADNIADVMGEMTLHRIRHMPVVEDGQLVGIISIGDVVKAQHDRLTMENHYLKSYIQS